MKITVETFVAAPIERVWQAYTTPSAICQWNAASDDWHTTESTVDLREGGAFSSRMEAKDGSVGFDFDGVYTQVVPHALLEYTMSERAARVEFVRQGEGVVVRVCFDADAEQSLEQQRQGWQSILENFKRHVEKAVA